MREIEKEAAKKTKSARRQETRREQWEKGEVKLKTPPQVPQLKDEDDEEDVLPFAGSVPAAISKNSG